MNGSHRLTLLLVSCLFLFGCNPSEKKHQTSVPTTKQPSETDIAMTIQYAKGFWIESHEGYILLQIKDPQSENRTEYQFVLKERGTKVKTPPQIPVIETPVSKLVCMTTLQLSNMIKLGAEEQVCGIASTRHLKSKKIKQQIDEGTTQRIGIEGNFDSEVIMSMSPDIIFISPFKQGGYEAMRATDIPLIPHMGYKEMTPLGQAEWIKLVALFIGEEKKANALFDKIEKEYLRLKALTEQVTDRPKVFSGELRGGSWYAVGGKSFLAQLFKDAGADYFLKDDHRSGGVNLDFETVYNQAEDAAFWRILNSYPGDYSYEVLRAQDARYADFKAFKERKVIYCNMRDKGFYESSTVEPEKVLADLIYAFHPDLLPDYEPTYYELLK